MKKPQVEAGSEIGKVQISFNVSMVIINAASVTAAV